MGIGDWDATDCVPEGVLGDGPAWAGVGVDWCDELGWVGFSPDELSTPGAEAFEGASDSGEV